MLDCLAGIQNRLASLAGVKRYDYLLRLQRDFELWWRTKSMRSFCGLREFQEFSRLVRAEISRTEMVQLSGEFQTLQLKIHD